MKRSIVFFGKLFICLTLIFALKSAMVETNKVATAEIGGWWAGNQGHGTAQTIFMGYAGGHMGAAAGSWAGQWIGGAIGSFGGPAGTYLGIVAGGAIGSVVGGA
jgi:hypothetical protein